jgi:hypothetical protein
VQEKGKPVRASQLQARSKRDGTHRLNPISNLMRADAMRIIPDNIGRLPVLAP